MRLAQTSSTSDSLGNVLSAPGLNSQCFFLFELEKICGTNIWTVCFCTGLGRWIYGCRLTCISRIHVLGIIGLLDGQCRCVRRMENWTHKHVENAFFFLTYTDVSFGKNYLSAVLSPSHTVYIEFST